jgi:hypothetical protein
MAGSRWRLQRRSGPRDHSGRRDGRCGPGAHRRAGLPLGRPDGGRACSLPRVRLPLGCAVCARSGRLLLNTGFPPCCSPRLTASIHADEVSRGRQRATRRGDAQRAAAILLIAASCGASSTGSSTGSCMPAWPAAGFAFSENILYLGRAFGEAGASGLTVVFFLRCLMGPFAHPLFTACTGIGIGLGVTVARSVWGRSVTASGIRSAPICLHGIWNLSALMDLLPGLLRLPGAAVHRRVPRDVCPAAPA